MESNTYYIHTKILNMLIQLNTLRLRSHMLLGVVVNMILMFLAGDSLRASVLDKRYELYIIFDMLQQVRTLKFTLFGEPGCVHNKVPLIGKSRPGGCRCMLVVRENKPVNDFANNSP